MNDIAKLDFITMAHKYVYVYVCVCIYAIYISNYTIYLVQVNWSYLSRARDVLVSVGHETRIIIPLLYGLDTRALLVTALDEGILEGTVALHWRHNGCDGVSNHQPHDRLFNHLFMRRSKKTSKLTGFCGPVNSPHKWPVTRKCFHLMTSSWNA